ncbi:MAG: phosphodiester glycosidase family protein [Spirochaetaceae bacterium]|nr:phosphodiester glycosidase family protein [Spirochaetaceae bacterium]
MIQRFTGKNRLSVIWAVFLFLPLFTSCVLLSGGGGFTDEQLPQLFPAEAGIPPPVWEPLAPGIDICSFSDSSVPLTLYGARIDLKSPGLTVIMTSPPPDGTGGVSREFSGETTLEFARRTGSLLAVNASPFNAPEGMLNRPRSAIGLALYRGVSYGEPPMVPRYGALLFMEDGGARIIPRQEESLVPPETVYAAGGFYPLLENGTILPPVNRIFDSRTAAGTAASGSILYLLVAEGEYPSRSRGLTFEESAAWLLWLGAEDGLSLDGGGSSAIVVRTSGGKYEILNKLYFPFNKGHIVGNNIGFSTSRQISLNGK